MLQNYRPICLTNCDYRILANVLANRLHKVLSYLISGDQTGYVKGRFIGQNIRIVEDIIYYASRNQSDSIIALLDFCKAFDSIEWAFTYEVLAKFNVCHDYIKWIKALYSDPKKL